MADEKDLFAPLSHEEKQSAQSDLFNPLTHEEKTSVANYMKTNPKASPGEALREGFAEGGTFGFAPRMGAALGAGLEKGAGAMGMGPQAGNTAAGVPEQSLSDLYNEYLNYNNKLQENAKASHPGMYYGGMAAGGIASPLNKIGAIGMGGETAEAALAAEKAASAGQAVQTASMPVKMALSGLSGARAGALGGLSQSKDLTDVKQDLENAGQGVAFGGAVGTAAPPVGAALKGTAKGLASGLETVFGPVGARFGQGMQAGAEGAPNLATQAGREETQAARGTFAKDFVDQLRKTVKSNAKDKVQMIQQHVADLPKDQIDNVLNQILETDSSKLGSKEAEEFELIKEEILRAKEGPMTTETVRQYNPGAQPPPIARPGSQFLPPINGPGEVLPPEGAPQAGAQAPPSGQDVTPPPLQQLGPGGIQNPPVPQHPPIMGQAERMGTPPEPPPAQFEGYEPIHKATVDADDEEARKLFEQKVHEKLIDEKKLGKNDNNNPVQIDEEPIPGTDKVRLVAKRAVESDEADTFKEQAQALTDRQKAQKQLQDLLDKQNEEAMKMKQQQEAEMAKPQFQDVQQDVRAGGRNIQSAPELYKLQQMMQDYGNPASPRLTTPDMQKVARDASSQLSGVLKKNVGTGDVDSTLHAFNNIGEVMGMSPGELNLPGGAGEKAQEDALKQVFKLINPQNLSDNDIVNAQKMKYVADQLRVINPELADRFVDSVKQQSQSKVLLKEFSKPYEPSGINPEFNIVRRLATKAAYGAGYSIGDQGRKISGEIGPAIQAGQKVFSQYAPQALQDMATRAASSGDKTMQQFGQVLSKLSTADERTRNAMIFVLEQQAGYKAMMHKLMEPEKQTTPQAKDKDLQKFK